VFRAKRADKVKLLFWDGTGVCLLIKRLEGAKFRWPAIQDGVMPVAGAALRASGGPRLGSGAHAPRAGAAGNAMILVTG
jgi:transposase